MRVIPKLPRVEVTNLWVLLILKVQLVPILFLLLILNLWNAYVWKCDQLKIMESLLQDVSEQLDNTMQLTSRLFGKDDVSEFKAVKVKVTMYNPLPSQGWGDGTKTFDGNIAVPGVIAISKDIQVRYKLRMGQKVMLGHYGVFKIADRMNLRKKNQVDIISFIPKIAKKFGVRKDTLYIPI